MSRRSLIILILIAALVAAVLIGTPYAIKHYATRWLMDNGGERVTFDDVDFNPFTARLVLEGLLVKVNDETTLAFKSASADLAWQPLLSKQIVVESITLDGFDILIDDRPEDRLLVGGIRIIDKKPADTPPPVDPEPWLAGVQTLGLNDIRVRFINNDLDIDLQLQELELGNVSQWEAESLTTLRTRGSLNNAPFEISGEMAPLAASPQYNLKVNISGLSLEHFNRLVQPQITQLAGHFSYQGDIGFRQLPAGIDVSQDGSARLQALTVKMENPAVNILNTDTAISGRLALSGSGADQDLDLSYDVNLQGLNVVAEDNTLELVRADKLTLSGLVMKGTDRLSIKNIDIGKFSFGRSADQKASDAFIDVDQFQVADLNFENRLLSIDQVSYRSGHSNIKRDAGGNFRVVGILESMNRLMEKQEAESAAEDPPEADAASPGEPQATAVSVNRIEVSGDSKVSFLDESVTPAFKTVVNLDSIVLEKLDTRAPEQMSPFKLQGGIGKHTKISMQGEVQPFLAPLGIDMKATVNALDLPFLSSYTRQSLGLVLDSGTLDSDASVVINKSKMDGKVNLKLHQLTFKNVESENSLQSRIPVPLDVALDTLRDKNNTIALKIPIKGDPANPDFDVNDAISQALATGVQKGALTYLTLALQPYGSLITAARYAGEAINKVRLKPVEFDAGLALIDATDKDYLSKVAAVLKDRPQVAIKVCGVAVQADVEYLQQQAGAKPASGAKPGDAQQPAPIDTTQLEALANARAASVKDHLVDTHQIPAARLVGCRPRVETDDSKALARTDLLI